MNLSSMFADTIIWYTAVINRTKIHFYHAINLFLMMLFETNNVNVIDKCRHFCGTARQSSSITIRADEYARVQ